MQLNISTFKLFLPPSVYMLSIFILSSIPGRAQSEHWDPLSFVEPHVQNMLHVPLFAILQILWLRAFTKLGRQSLCATIIGLSISVTYSFLDELHQHFVPGRYASLQDVLLNIVGVVLGTFLYFNVLINIRNRRVRLDN